MSDYLGIIEVYKPFVGTLQITIFQKNHLSKSFFFLRIVTWYSLLK